MALGAASSARAACGTTVTVQQVGGTPNCTDIQTCINTIPASLAVDYCVDVLDSATYAAFTVQGKASNGFRITVGPQNPANRPTINPGGPGVPAIQVFNTSVTVQNMQASGSGPLIAVTSGFVTLDGVSVFGSGAGVSGDAAVSVSSWTTVVRSSISVNASGGLAYVGLRVSGLQSVVSQSTMTGSGTEIQEVLELKNGSSNTVTQTSIANANCYAALIGPNAAYNTISQSTMTGANSGCSALHLTGAARNLVTQSYLFNPSGNALLLDTIGGAASFNTISFSTIAAQSANDIAVVLQSADNTVLDHLYVIDSGTTALQSAGSLTSISWSTFSVSAAGARAAEFDTDGTVANSYFLNSAIAGDAVYVAAGSNVSIAQSTISATAGAADALESQSGSGLLCSGCLLTAFGGRAAHLNGSVNDTLFQSTMTSVNGVALFVDRANSASISASAIDGMTGASVVQSSFTFFNGSNLRGRGQPALDLSHAASTTTLQGVVLVSTNPSVQALRAQGSASGLLIVSAAAEARGNVDLLAGLVQLSNAKLILGRDATFSAPVTAGNVAGSTLAFDGANTPVSAQKISIGASSAFDHLTVNAASVTFVNNANTLSANTLIDTVAGSTLAFQPGPGGFSIQYLRALGSAGSGRITLMPKVPGAQFPLAVSASSMSFVRVSSSAASGATIHANEGGSIDLGGNTNWNFLPFLALTVAPGQSWIEGVGNSGGPAVTAGGANVTVRAVSAASTTVTTAGFSVTLNSDDPNEPGLSPQALAGGQTTFTLAARTARTDLLQASGGLLTYAGAAYSASVPVGPGPFTRLQLLVPSETPAPGSPSGKSGAPNNIVVGSTIAVLVRSVDQFWNLVSTGTDLVQISTSGANLPQQTNLVSGATTFTTIVFASSGTARTLAALDLTNGGILGATSSPFGVFDVTSASPSVSIAFALNSLQTTLGGGIHGTALDGTGVTGVRAAFKHSAGNFFDWGSQTFIQTSASFTAAGLSQPGGTGTSWMIPLADSLLINDTYYVIAIASNASGNFIVAETTFVFRTGGLVAGSSGDGQGSAAAGVSSGLTCQVLTATITVTAGPAGIAPGGAIALRLPDNWQTPQGPEDPVNPPVNPGSLHVSATSTYTLDFNPSTHAGATLGNNWIVFNANTGVMPGALVQFTYKGFPGGGPRSVGPQVFAVMTQGGGGGNLKPIASQPGFLLSPGPASQLQFIPNLPLTVGALQPSPTMQLLVTDNCGNSTNTATAGTIALNAGQYGAPDTAATFYAAGGALLGPSGAALPIAGGAGVTPGFYFVTGTTQPFENLIATMTLGAQAAFGGRFVRVLASSVSLTGVSVDTGTAAPGQTSVTMTGSSFQGAAVVNFTLSDPALRWEVVISTSNTTFYPELAHRFGAGNPGRTLTWAGVNETSWPQRFLPPGGPYYVKIRVEGGVVEDTTLQVFIAQSASIYGTVNSTGAFAFVQANGPGASYGNFAVASSTGYFQIFGLKAGGRYNILATTGTVRQGQFLRLTSSSNNVTAALAGTDIGAIPFPTPSLLRVSVQIPSAAPYDFWGGVNAHTQDYANSSFGTLHYPTGADKSDDGSQSFGATASTWTVLGLLPGTYDVDLNLQQVGISSAVRGVVVAAGATTDLAVSLPRKANVYGWAVLPSTSPFGNFISVQGTKAGARNPSVFGGAFVQGADTPPALTSGTYALFGLDPGSWTITARAFGFASVSSTVYVSSSADVGSQANGGFDLRLSSGGVISGTLNLIGDSTLLPALNSSQGLGLDVFINAWNPQNYTSAGTQIHITTSSTLSSTTFTIRGLDDGSYFMGLYLQGASPVYVSVPVVGGAGAATLNSQVNSSRVFLSVQLPGNPPPSEYRKVALYSTGQGGPSLAQDLVGGNTVQYFASSATWQSRALGAGYYQFTALYGKTGAFKTVSVPLTNGTTAFAVLDLSPSTFTVSGRVVLSADVNFHNGGAAVSVSSIPGVLANSASVTYCVMGAPAGVATSAFHLELLPITPYQGYLDNPPLTVAQVGGNCAAPQISNNIGGNSPNPFHVYLASISADGSFAFAGVPPGAYLLRNPTDLDGNSGTDELPPVRQLVTVSSDTTGLTFRLDKGVTIAGSIQLPPGLTGTRSFSVALLDSTGRPVKTQIVNLNNANSAAYAFDRVPDGAFAVKVDDFGYPRIYGAKPLTLKVAGAALSGQDVPLVQTGIIKGKLAVLQSLAGTTTRQFLLITGDNVNLLPKSLNIRAEANPWFQGGSFQSQNLNCAGGCNGFTLDANDQFVIDGVLPGVYDVRYESYDDPNDNSSISLVRSRTPGVAVSEGRTTDMGTVNLTGATQLRGTIYDAATSSPVANVAIRAKPAVATSDQRNDIRATTDKNGQYTLVGLDPNIKLYDVYANFRGEGDTLNIPTYELKIAPSVDVTSTSVVDFRLRWAPWWIAGRVVGAAGGPALTQPFSNGFGDIKSPGAAVFLQRTDELPHDNPIADIQVPTGPDGGFLIPALTTGTYKMVVASLGYSSLSKIVTISTGSVNLGTLTLGIGGSLSGQIRKPDGSNPSQREVDFLGAVTADLSELLVAALTKDKNTNTVTAYSISGFRPGVRYQMVIGDDSGGFGTPDEARSVTFSTTTESRTLDIVLRPTRPIAFAKVRKQGTQFSISFALSQPLRAKTAADSDATALLSTFSAAGALTQVEVSANRSLITALYSPAVTESSFTLKLHAFSTLTDPDSLDPVDPEFVYLSTYTFFTGVDGVLRSNVSNVNGGTLLVEGDSGRVQIPGGAFSVDASSTVEVTLQVSQESLSGAAASGLKGAAANVAALRKGGAAYPSSMLSAMAATPPQVSPFSGFYDILLPLGVRTALQKPVKMTIAYSTSTDPSTLNIYWYNAAANAYVLQQDVTGAPRVIDTVNHTITINVNHFSTFVLFNTGVAVITGQTFVGSDFEAYNFPNPFDLSAKSVTPSHVAGAQTVRGTMIRFALPQDVTGDGSIRIFNVVGERVRTIELGALAGGQYYYQPWDGRNDSGRDVASGVYIGQVKVGGKSKFFKMALIK